MASNPNLGVQVDGHLSLSNKLYGVSHYAGFAIVQVDPDNPRHPKLAYDEVVFDRLRRIVMVGERRQFMYALEMRILNEELRQRVAAQLCATAERLGLAQTEERA